MGTALRCGSCLHSLKPYDAPESVLSVRDGRLATVIESQSSRWPCLATEDPIWGLIRMVMAQQISTRAACRISEKLKSEFPSITRPTPESIPDLGCFTKLGLPKRRAECCVSILHKSNEIRVRIASGESWEGVLRCFKGIGPWTISVFRIMVLREPDILPLRDVGLERAVASIYGSGQNIERLSDQWRPFRSVACWYLWRTLGNEQLG